MEEESHTLPVLSARAGSTSQMMAEDPGSAMDCLQRRGGVARNRTDRRGDRQGMRQLWAEDPSRQSHCRYPEAEGQTQGQADAMVVQIEL
jgi:hypothetical protein